MHGLIVDLRRAAYSNGLGEACFGTMSFRSHSECEHIFDCSVRHCTNELTMEGITVKVKEKRKHVG
ncbi:hypothetical protein D918_03107 [Trichuris suis]|nr:hypothetical protein D918_03107 [Trichuris suis]